jgi:transcriptional regulator with XRE-family HTH domain
MSSEPTFKERVAAALKRRRLVLGLNQSEASDRVRILPAELSRWESGFRTPRLVGLWRLCAAYRVTPAALFREDQPLLPPDWPPEALDALRESPELREAVAAILKTQAQRGEP